ncbi:MAG: hypothetical protein ACOC9Y_05890, partial [Chloroflexota bacterium]
GEWVRLNLWILFLSLGAGIVGAWYLQAAFDDYLDATRSYTQVDLRYEDESFKWLDAEYENSEAELTFTNRSSHVVTVAVLDVFLYFDEEFAGADYTTWDPLVVDPGESESFTVGFQTSSNTIQDQGGDADLSLGGRMQLEFEDIAEPLSIRFTGDVGQVDWEGS